MSLNIIGAHGNFSEGGVINFWRTGGVIKSEITGGGTPPVKKKFCARSAPKFLGYFENRPVEAPK